MTILRLLFATLITTTAATYAAAEDAWIPLFNGRDLSGWKSNAYPDSWSVVDGMLRVQATKESCHLFYVGDGTGDFVRFKNFELEVVARAEPNANSGIYVHTSLATYASQLRLRDGYEIQLNSTTKEKRKTGSLYAIKDLDTSPVDETQWFTVLITVKDKHIVVRINGATVVDYVEPENVAAERTGERKHRVLRPDGGAIALQGHDPHSVFYFKSVRLRPLP